MRFRGQTWGWELATLSSQSHTLGALAFAGRVLPDATPRGMRGSRSHGGIVPAVASRNLSSEASTPGSAAACQQQSAGRGADTPATCVARVGTVTTGSAPAFGRALAPCYGSDLLTLRLHFASQLGDVVFRAAPRKEVFRALPDSVSPRSASPFARPAHAGSGPFWRGGLARTWPYVLICAVATLSLWGNCVGARIETPRAPDSARPRFLIAPRRTAPKSYH